MSYHPRGNVKTILDAMAAADHDLEWTTDELAQLVGISTMSLSSTLKTALREELLFKQKRGVHTFYSLTSYEPQAQEVEFDAAQYLDGGLVVWGIPINEDGSFTINKDQLAKIKRMVAWSTAP